MLALKLTLLKYSYVKVADTWFSRPKDFIQEIPSLRGRHFVGGDASLLKKARERFADCVIVLPMGRRVTVYTRVGERS